MRGNHGENDGARDYWAIAPNVLKVQWDIEKIRPIHYSMECSLDEYQVC